MITTKLPNSIVIDGETYPIRTDFRVWIEFENRVFAPARTQEERVRHIAEAICIVLPSVPADMGKTVQAVIEFYTCGQKPKGKNDGKRCYDFEQDAGYLYSAFLEQYKTDLQDVEFLHWWKFRAMFKSLKANTRLVEIMGYRSMDISTDMPDKMRKFYEEMKETYALPGYELETERRQDLMDALEKGDMTEYEKKWGGRNGC